MLKITKGLISTDVTGITQYIDDKGNKYVRVKMDGEDFCIAARDYARGRKHTFTWSYIGDPSATDNWGYRHTDKSMHLMRVRPIIVL